MKKLFSLLTLALLTMSAWAATEVTIDFSAQGYGNAEEVSTLTVGDVTVDLSQGTNTSNGPKYYTTGTGVRLYVGNTLTLTSAGDNITKAVFTFSGDGYTFGSNTTANTGVYSESGATGTWVGNAANFTVSSTRTCRLQKIEVTLGGEVIEAVLAPSLPESRKFQDNYTVQITNNEVGATVKYSIDEQATWSTYSAPFTINTTSTVYAKAVKGNVESTIVNATYTKLEGVDGSIAFLPADFDAVSSEPWEITKDNVTLACDTGSIDYSLFRIFKGHTLSFTSSDADIIKIEFTCTAKGTAKYGPGCFAAQAGYTYETDGYIGTWVGKAKTVSFTAETNQVRATQIVVTLDDGSTVVVAAPTFDPAAKEFEESITVAITAEEGAAIKYNYDNGETWNDYTTPLTLTETTTIYAKAVKDGVESAVAHATYTKVEPSTGITTLAQANALPNDSVFTFTGENDVVVTYQNGKYTFLRDATGFGEFYQDNASTMPTLTNGQVLNSNWSATKTTYKGLPEYKNATNVSASDKTNETLAAPVEISALSNEMINAYVTVKNIKKFNYTGSGKSFTVTLSDGTTLTGYNQFNISLSDLPPEDGDYTAIGVVGIYNNLQFWLISWSGEATPVAVEAPVFDPAGGSFTGTQTVTLTCETEGAQIYYALGDGEYQLYETPFTLNATTTVKAKAVKGDAESAEVTATYTKRAEVSNIAAANELDNKTDFVFYGPAVVVYQNDKNLWIKDNTGFGLIYGSVGTIAEGSTLAEGWEAQHYIFRGKIHEYQYPTGVAADPDEELQTITATEYTRDQLGESNINERVMIKDLTLVEETDSINQYWKRYMYNIVDGDTLTVYKFENIEYPAIEEGKTYDVEAMVSYYGGKVQLLPIAITEHTAAGLRGDVDNSGNVDISDATALINYLLYGNSEGLNMDNANCDLTGGIDITDATTLINYLLYGSW
jgi:hypothetical protein